MHIEDAQQMNTYLYVYLLGLVVCSTFIRVSDSRSVLFWGGINSSDACPSLLSL